MADTGDPLDLSVVLPARDEAAAVSAVLDELTAALSATDLSWEVVVVDDGSRDDTAARCAGRPGVTVVRRPSAGGMGAAIKTGLLAARGENVAFLDADGSYDAGDVPRLVSLLDAGADLATGVRGRERGTDAWLRVPVKWLLRMLGSALALRLIPDLNSGMRAVRREALLAYLPLLPDGFSHAATTTLAFLLDGRRTRWAAIGYRPRVGRSKFHPVRDTWAYARAILTVTGRLRPLRLLVPPSLLLLLGGAVLVLAHTPPPSLAPVAVAAGLAGLGLATRPAARSRPPLPACTPGTRFEEEPR